MARKAGKLRLPAFLRTVQLGVQLGVLASCATLEPDALLLEAGHQSSIVQHFESHDPNVGVQTLGLAARWQRGRWIGDVSEAYAVSGMTICARQCPRDVFNVTVGYEFPLK